MHGIIRIYVDEDDHVVLPASVRDSFALTTEKSGEMCYHIVFKSRRQACVLFKELCEILERTEQPVTTR